MHPLAPHTAVVSSSLNAVKLSSSPSHTDDVPLKGDHERHLRVVAPRAQDPAICHQHLSLALSLSGSLALCSAPLYHQPHSILIDLNCSFQQRIILFIYSIYYTAGAKSQLRNSIKSYRGIYILYIAQTLCR